VKFARSSAPLMRPQAWLRPGEGSSLPNSFLHTWSHVPPSATRKWLFPALEERSHHVSSVLSANRRLAIDLSLLTQ